MAQMHFLGHQKYKTVHGGSVITYPLAHYDFPHTIKEIFQVPDLEKLHEFQSYELFKRETDQKTVWHAMYYDNFAEKIKPLYDRFITECIRPLFPEPIAYQRIPTFRVHLPNNLGVGEFHRDSDYQHPFEEINFLLPLTRATDTSTIWLESVRDKKDYAPVNLIPGEVFTFSGSEQRHGNVINETGRTRVSFDFRIIPFSHYKENQSGSSINTKMKFVIGDYYTLAQ